MSARIADSDGEDPTRSVQRHTQRTGERGTSRAGPGRASSGTSKVHFTRPRRSSRHGWRAVGQDGPVTGPLISTAALRDVLGAVTVLDVRYRMGGPPGLDEYAAGHLPGAAYVDLDADLAAPPGPDGRHPLPDRADFQAAMRRAGVSADRPVVVYDDWSAHAAGRCWWLLRHHGHPDVRVLDGGWSAWRADGGAVEAGIPAPPVPGTFTAGPGAMPVIGPEHVRDVEVLVDARAAERYRGEAEPVDPVAGHVPGAVNVPTSRNLTHDGRFRTREELRALYAEVGAVPGADVAAYCGSGVTATHDLLALELAGVTAALYPGSWSSWVPDPSRPVARGDGSIVRAGTAADVPALVALGEAVWPVAYAFDPAAAEHTIATWWTPAATATSLEQTDWVAVEVDGRVVAAGNLDTRQPVPTVWKLLTHPEHQGRGHGTTVLRA